MPKLLIARAAVPARSAAIRAAADSQSTAKPYLIVLNFFT
jgi:hypothetical protein